MSKKIKVLLADDSSVVRRLLKEVLQREKDIEVVYEARHGAEAVGFCPQCKPDVVLLDVEMPEMDGVEAARAIHALDNSLPIIMFSSLTSKGGAATLDALEAGAVDYVTKPMAKGHVSEAIRQIQSDLIPKIRDWGGKRKGSLSLGFKSKPSCRKPDSKFAAKAGIVAVGVSTGGPDVLSEFLAELPNSFPAPVLIVQHMPPIFTKLLAERLDKVCQLPVREASSTTELLPGQVWIAPGDKHLRVGQSDNGHELVLSNDPPVNSCRPAVDVLFNSVADHFGSFSVAVVLTGMGQDGLAGCRRIHEAGGTILIQDQETSTVWGMPGAVSAARLSHAELPPKELGKEIVRMASSLPKSMASSR